MLHDMFLKLRDTQCQICYDSVAGEFWPGYISNFRLVKGTAVYSGAFTPSTTPLTAVSGTSLLTCQSNRFIDTNTQAAAKTITVNGSPSVVAFSPFNPTASWSAATYGGSGYFDGNSDYLRTTGSALAVGSGTFTYEAWVYPTSISATISGIFDSRIYTGSAGTNGIGLFLTSGGEVRIDNSAGAILTTSGAAITVNSWVHIAVEKSGGNLIIYVNGVSKGSVANSATYSSTEISIGTSFSNSWPLTGYISSFRLVTSAVYGGAFTPPTAPLTNITNTSLLLNFTNAGIYDATSKNDLETLDNTVNGVRISTAQSQFGGSSILFDGTGTDYLWIQADQPIQRFGTGNFTIELWIRLAATGSARGLVAKGTSTTGWLVSLNTSNQVVFTYGTSTITSTGTISASVWTYIAVVREGTGTNQTKIYIDGNNDGTGTVSTDFNQTNAMYLGANRTGGDLFSGYMQDVRITNGIARTTITSTPTAAFPTF